MKAIVTKPVEIEVSTILIDIAPRYIGDTADDDVPSDMPLLDGENWRATVNIDSGQILDWPEGEERRFWCKVCDAGNYVLFDPESNEVGNIENGYVPHGVVPGEYGDYIDLKIGGDGVITNWPESPNLDDFFSSDED